MAALNTANCLTSSLFSLWSRLIFSLFYCSINLRILSTHLVPFWSYFSLFQTDILACSSLNFTIAYSSISSLWRIYKYTTVSILVLMPPKLHAYFLIADLMHYVYSTAWIVFILLWSWHGCRILCSMWNVYSVSWSFWSFF